MSVERMLKELEEAVLTGKDDLVSTLCEQALKDGIDPLVVLDKGLAPGVKRAGEKMGCGEYFLPQLVMAGEAMKAGMKLILPKLTGKSKREITGNIVIGSVEGDVHDIGKGIVVALMTAAGFNVVDLGVDVPASEFAKKVISEKADILGMGSYMSTTLPAMKAVMEELTKSGHRGEIKVIIGGVAATEDYANRIGADGFAPDGPKAVELAERIMRGAK
ncbi:MAG: cobalamin-dependent protein [Syntrophobacteraceae bacterium]